MTTRIPASPEQRRLWLIDRYEGGGRAYVVPLVWTLYGTVDVPALAAAVDAVVVRHESLRCAFRAERAEEDAEVELTVVAPPREVLSVRRASSDAEVDAALEEFLAEPFDLAAGRVFRAALWTMPDDEAVLCLAAHHAVLDGWSASILAADLAELYRDPDSPLPPVPGMAELNRRREPAPAESATHWRDALAGVPEVLRLPLDRPRGADQDWAGGTCSRRLSKMDTDRLRRVAAEHRTTTFVVALAALGVFLARWCDEEDMVVGVPFAADRDEDTERAVGFFVNTVPLRLDLRGTPTFDELIRRVQRTVSAALTHQATPLEEIIRTLGLDRVSGRHPLFQVMFAYQNVPEVQLRLGKVRARPRPAYAPESKFDLLINLAARGDRADLRFEYRRALFDDDSAEDATDAFARVLAQCLAEPAIRVSDVDCGLPGSASLPATAVEVPTVLDTIAAQVSAEPDAVAVVGGDRALTRGELWRAAGGLASRLRAAGVRDGVPVGSLLARGAGLPVSMLGIWLAGGVYVPLDPASPARHTESLLDDAGARVVVVDDPGTPVGDRVAVPWTGEPGEPPGEARPPRAAYVMYTSGSTGRRKGVLVGHASLAGLIAEMARIVEPRQDDTVLAATTVTFDISLVELLLPLTTGARCLVADAGEAGDPVRLAGLIAARGATVVQATPSVWRLLAEHLDRPVRVAICGGEPLPPEVRDAVSAAAERAFNVYGPTETTIWSAAWPLAPGPVSIGEPLRGNQFVVLDRWGAPAPAGTWGELWIAGPALALGYLNRPVLNAAAFADLPGIGRAYRTGDVARRLRAGGYEVRGRVDDQLKVRGFRIEPGEVEAAIKALPAVRDSAVVAVRTGENTTLAALVVPDPDHPSATVDDWVDDWTTQWDEVYADLAASEFAGWVSSVTGEPYPRPVMEEWADATAAVLGSLGFRRVLEIGAGSGVLTRRLAGKAESWCATDVAPRSVARLRELGRELDSGFTVLHQPAHEWAGIPAGFDLALFNSVVQYFPDRDYLDEVLAGCLDRLAPGGRVFVGDVRSLPLAAAQYRAAARARGVPPERLAATERELLLDPGYFHRLAIARGDMRVQIRPKHLDAWSEMSAFRFDVLLTKAPAPAAPVPREHDWPGEAGFARICGSGVPAVVRGITHEHVRPWLAPDAPASTPNALVAAARNANRAAVVRVDPADPTRMCAFVDRTVAGARALAASRPPTPADRPLSNTPFRPRAGEFDPDRIEDRLARTLPAYLVPGVFVTAAALPLLPSGKVDRHRVRALVAEHLRPARQSSSPEDPVTATVRAAWARVLGRAGFAATDSFFRLGGDSLGAVRVLSMLRRQLGVELRLPQFIEEPTLSGFCAIVRDRIR